MGADFGLRQRAARQREVFPAGGVFFQLSLVPLFAIEVLGEGGLDDPMGCAVALLGEATQPGPQCVVHLHSERGAHAAMVASRCNRGQLRTTEKNQGKVGEGGLAVVNRWFIFLTAGKGAAFTRTRAEAH